MLIGTKTLVVDFVYKTFDMEWPISSMKFCNQKRLTIADCSISKLMAQSNIMSDKSNPSRYNFWHVVQCLSLAGGGDLWPSSNLASFSAWPHWGAALSWPHEAERHGNEATPAAFSCDISKWQSKWAFKSGNRTTSQSSKHRRRIPCCAEPQHSSCMSLQIGLPCSLPGLLKTS